MSQQDQIFGTVFDIQGYSVHDGPGGRTLVFMKGCPMRCKWCSNPEGQSLFPEPLYLKARCVHDALCIKECASGAIGIDGDSLVFDKSKCHKCQEYSCAKVCCGAAVRIAGYKISLDELFRKIQKDRAFWGKDGGVTLTGGEPLLQSEFAVEILKRCYDSYIHTAIETCGFVPRQVYERVIAHLDWMFFDLKHIDDEKHIEGTGVSNKLILENARWLASKFKGRMVFRIVIIPSYNDSDESIDAFVEFIKSLALAEKEVNVLPLHHMGREKYTMLGRKYFYDDLTMSENSRMEGIKEIFISHGIKCYIGSDTPF